MCYKLYHEMARQTSGQPKATAQLNTRVDVDIYDEFTTLAAKAHRSAAAEMRRMIEERVRAERKSKLTVIDGGEAA